MIDHNACLLEHPYPVLDLQKWQESVNLLAEIYDSACGAIVQYREREFSAVRTSDNEDNFLGNGDTWSIDIQSFCRRIMETNMDLYVYEASGNPEWCSAPPVAEGPVRSYLGFPLYWPDGSFFGTICVIDTKESNYSDLQIKLLAQFRDLVMKDLEIIENYERMLALALKVTTDGQLPEILTLLTSAMEVTAFDKKVKCSVCTLEDGRYLRFGAGPSLPEDFIEAVNGLEIGPDVGSCGAAIHNNAPMVVEDIQAHPNWEAFQDLAKDSKLGACWSYPIESSFGEVIGAFALYFEEPTAYDPRFEAAIESSLHNIKVAIEHSRLVSDLRQARTTAELANQSKTNFLNNMSHELRTPLNAIIGFSDIIAAQSFGPVENDRYVDYAKDISASGWFLMELIDDILEISKIEAEEADYAPEEVLVRDVVEQCLRLVEPRAQQRKISFQIDIDSDDLIAFMNKRHLKQVITNLLTNAVKYTDENDVILISSVTTADAVEIAIIDNGSGIPSEKMDQVFVPFKQFNDDTAHISKDGVGLGLPLAKKLMEQNKGDIQIASKQGQGTKATIIAPLRSNIA